MRGVSLLAAAAVVSPHAHAEELRNGFDDPFHVQQAVADLRPGAAAQVPYRTYPGA